MRVILYYRKSTPVPLQRISVTNRGQFDECRRKWYLQTVENCGGERIATPLWFGTAVHEGLEWYYKGVRTETVIHAGYRAGIQRIIEQLRQDFDDEYIMREIDEHVALGVHMLTNYVQYDAEDNPGWVVESTEQRLTATIPGTDVLLSGRIDMLVRIDGDLWIVDHKTASQSISPLALEVDDQITAYCYLIYRNTGVLPAGGIYNVLLKKKTWLLQKNKPVGGWTGHFQRLPTERSLEELQSFEQRLQIQAPLMQQVSDNPHLAYPVPSARKCGYCEFLTLCKSMDRQEDVTDKINRLKRTISIQ